MRNKAAFDGKIHVPARRRLPVSQQQVVRVTPEAYNVLVDIFNESTLSMKEIASLIIMESADRIVFDKEDE